MIDFFKAATIIMCNFGSINFLLETINQVTKEKTQQRYQFSPKLT